MGQPPRIAGPVTGAAPIAPAAGERGRDGSGQAPRRDGRKDQPAGEARPDPEPAPPPPPPDPLVEALDRLRATNELRPVDIEVARLLQAQRAYGAQPRPAEEEG